MKCYLERKTLVRVAVYHLYVYLREERDFCTEICPTDNCEITL